MQLIRIGKKKMLLSCIIKKTNYFPACSIKMLIVISANGLSNGLSLFPAI